MSPILAYLTRARQTLGAFAQMETDPETLMQIAEAHAALNRAVELWQAGAINPDPISGTIHVHDGAVTHVVAIGDPTTPTGLACECGQTTRSYRGVCAHIAAVRLAEVDASHQRELAARRERRQRWEVVQAAYFAAVAEREAIYRAYRAAEAREATAFAAAGELLAQVYLDERNAAAEASAEIPSGREVAA